MAQAFPIGSPPGFPSGDLRCDSRTLRIGERQRATAATGLEEIMRDTQRLSSLSVNEIIA